MVTMTPGIWHPRSPGGGLPDTCGRYVWMGGRETAEAMSLPTDHDHWWPHVSWSWALLAVVSRHHD